MCLFGVYYSQMIKILNYKSPKDGVDFYYNMFISKESNGTFSLIINGAFFIQLCFFFLSIIIFIILRKKINSNTNKLVARFFYFAVFNV